MVIRSFLRCVALAAGLTSAALLPAQTLSNKSLTGKYLFREVLIVTDSAQTLTIFGTVTFDGNTSGAFTYSGQLLTGSNPPTSANGNGTYSVDSGGVVTMSDPLRSGSTVNARLGNGALVGSNTEAGNNVNSILVAVAAPTSATSASTISGAYSVASIELFNGTFASRRQTFFPLTADGSGGFGNPNIVGAATTLSDRQTTQTVTGATYTVNADGTGTAVFPGTNQLLSGTKNIYVAQDGSFFFGGDSGAGGQGLLIGISAGSNVTSATLSGVFWSADLRLEGQSYSSYTGSAIGLGNGNMTASRRLRFNTGALDVTALVPYALNQDGSGSGTAIDNLFAVAGNGKLFLGSGLSTADTSRYELFFGIATPSVSGSGIFLNPQAVFNVFSFGPAGNPIAPGEFITIYGTGLPPQKAVSVPFPLKLGGVQLLINNTPAPLYLMTSTQVFGVVPYSLTSSTATIVLDNNGTRSNTITVPVAATAPGIAAVAQNGLGAGAITHANGSLISTDSPAARGETVVIYLTGLGQTSPAGIDGAAAKGLNTTNSVLAVYFSGNCGPCDGSNITYQGLTPGFAGLYQINVAIPASAQLGLAIPLAIATTNGFTDMVDIAIQ